LRVYWKRQAATKVTFTLKPETMALNETGKCKEPKPATMAVKEIGIKGWLKGKK
jgi:hypothetical protein